jgi:uncharacterized coiled-coil protein SlyX
MKGGRMKTMNRCMVLGVFVLGVCVSAQGQKSPEEMTKALEEMKQRDAESRADRLERRLAEAIREIDRLTGDLAAANAALAQARAETEHVRQRARDLEEQLRLYGAVPRVAAIASPDGDIPLVSARQIQITGERYIGKPVRLVGCTFSTAHANYTNTVPGIERQPDGSIRILRSNDPPRWIGLIFTDANGNHFFHAYASKDRYAELLLGLKRGTKIDISAVVVPTLAPPESVDDPADRYALICESIEVAP